MLHARWDRWQWVGMLLTLGGRFHCHLLHVAGQLLDVLVDFLLVDRHEFPRKSVFKAGLKCDPIFRLKSERSGRF
jgi:hypothetical protein